MKKLMLVLGVVLIAIGPLFITGCKRRHRGDPPGTQPRVNDPGWTEIIEDSETTKRETHTEMPE